MNNSELKLWFINLSVLTISFSQVENTLKIIALLVAIGYSIDKWRILRQKRDNDEIE